MGLLEFFIHLILATAILALGSTQPLTETSNRNISWELKAAVAYHLHVPTVLKSGSVRASPGPYRDCFTLLSGGKSKRGWRWWWWWWWWQWRWWNQEGYDREMHQGAGVTICKQKFNPLNAELNPICYLLALLGAHHFLHVSRIRVNHNKRTPKTSTCVGGWY